jgi:outer membrane protein assembly factor BamD (BamD/ComL family)
MNKIKFFLTALIFFLSASRAYCAVDDGQVYAKILTGLLRVSSQDASEEQVKLLNDSRQAFYRFADEHPRSIYADDSRFIYCLVEFIGALMVPPRDMDNANEMISLMDQTVQKYPGGRIEGLTYDILKKELGDQAVGGSFYMPYGRIVEYMQALMASQTRDYKSAAVRYSRLIDRMRPFSDENVAMEIYVPLYIAYLRMGKDRDARALADEVSGAFPGSELLAVLEEINAAEKNKKDND